MIISGQKVAATLTFVFIINNVNAAKILAVLPTPSISHQLAYRPLTHALAKRGHEVIVITPDPAFPIGQAPSNLKEIDVHNTSYSNWKTLLKHHTGDKEDLVQQLKESIKHFSTTLDVQLQTQQVQEVLRKDRKYFDLLLLEYINRPALGFASIFDAPVILISSFGIGSSQYARYGAPMHPIYYPGFERRRLYNLTLWEKGVEILKHAIYEYLVISTEESDYSIMKKHFGENIPTFDELRKKVQLLFINEHQMWSDNHPVPPNILYIGGIHQPELKNISQELQEYLDSSKNGVVYVSFGTNVLTSLLPEKKIALMKNVFSQLPYNFLWKFDDDNLRDLPKNVKISKWFPQPEILNHPNVKLFITQGGLQSTDETIDALVPVIGIPMLADQWYNTEKYVHHKIGLQLELNSLTEESFKSSIETVINDKSYKENIIKLQKIMKRYPIKPLDLAVWWTEHVMEFGGEHLRPLSAFVGSAEYYQVKLISTALVVFTTILALIGFTIRFCLKYMTRKIFRTKTKTL